MSVILRKLSSPIPMTNANYQDFRDSSIFFTFSLNNTQNTNSLSKINNHAISNRNISYISELVPTNITINSEYFTILNNKVTLNSSFFNSSVNNLFFQNTNLKASNFNILPTSSGDLWFIFRYNINRDGKRTSRFNDNAANIANIFDDIVFEFTQIGRAHV